jgi:glycerol kinase
MILTLDLGTTSNRCLAINASGQIVAFSQKEFLLSYPQPGWVEQNPDELWTSALAVLQQVIEQIDISGVLGVAITNQRETTIAWDKDSGKSLGPAIVWQCRRTAARINALDSLAKAAITHKTGLLPDAYFSASKMEWILLHNSEARRLHENGKLCFGTVDSWIIWNLTAGKSFVTDESNASRTMLYNIRTHEYDDELLEIFSVSRDCLPVVLDSNACFGFTDTSFTKKAFPIHAVMGDQQASLFAQCGDDTKKIKNTYGTGLFICCSTGESILESSNLISTVAWRFNGRSTYALEGPVFVGGAIIQWLRDQLQMIESASESEVMALSLPSNEGVYCVPALAGLGAPHWDSSARGLFIGLSRQSRKEHFVRAALESIAYQTKDVIDCIGSLKKEKNLDALFVDGGATENSFLMQFQADLLRIPVVLSSFKESTALGVAGVAGIALNMFSEAQFRLLFASEKQFFPKRDFDTMENYYSLWKKATDRAKQWQN